MKKYILVFFFALLLFLSNTSASHASVIFQDSFQGGINNSSWIVESNDPNHPEFGNHFTTSAFGIKDIATSGNHSSLVTTTNSYLSNNEIKIDVKINSSPSGMNIMCRYDNLSWTSVFGAQFYPDGTGNTLDTFGSSDHTPYNWDNSAGIHHFDVICNGSNLKILEDGNFIYDDLSHTYANDTTSLHGEISFGEQSGFNPGDSEFANFQMCDMNGCTTPTPTPTPAPDTIVVSPSTSTVNVGTPFNTTIVVSGGHAFNAAQAHVVTSSNLTITGIHAAPSPQCNLQYTQTPTINDPSFAGAIYGSSSTNCNVYTLTLTPNAAGSGTITLTNGAIKAFADSSEILSGVTNGSFTINAATPTPTPVGASTLTLDDSIQGTGQNQWNYVGSNWGHCTNCNDTATFYNASISWDKTTDEYVTLPFTGTQILLYGFTDPRDGIGAVSIDNGTETNVDFYSATRTGNVLLWTSPSLPNTAHTLKLRVTGTHDSNATDTYIGPDRADIMQGATNTSGITFNTYPLDTYASMFTLSGGKDASLTSIFVNGSAANSTYPTATTWQNPLTLALGINTFHIYGTDSANNQTATQSIQINKHILGDINGDGVIDLTDASLFAVDYGKTSNLTYPLSDMNGDGQVDLTDLSILAKLESQ